MKKRISKKKHKLHVQMDRISKLLTHAYSRSRKKFGNMYQDPAIDRLNKKQQKLIKQLSE